MVSRSYSVEADWFIVSGLALPIVSVLEVAKWMEHHTLLCKVLYKKYLLAF
jgi:hypothetical protein